MTIRVGRWSVTEIARLKELVNSSPFIDAPLIAKTLNREFKRTGDRQLNEEGVLWQIAYRRFRAYNIWNNEQIKARVCELAGQNLIAKEIAAALEADLKRPILMQELHDCIRALVREGRIAPVLSATGSYKITPQIEARLVELASKKLTYTSMARTIKREFKVSVTATTCKKALLRHGIVRAKFNPKITPEINARMLELARLGLEYPPFSYVGIARVIKMEFGVKITREGCRLALLRSGLDLPRRERRKASSAETEVEL